MDKTSSNNFLNATHNKSLYDGELELHDQYTHVRDEYMRGESTDGVYNDENDHERLFHQLVLSEEEDIKRSYLPKPLLKLFRRGELSEPNLTDSYSTRCRTMRIPQDAKEDGGVMRPAYRRTKSQNNTFRRGELLKSNRTARGAEDSRSSLATCRHRHPGHGRKQKRSVFWDRQPPPGDHALLRDYLVQWGVLPHEPQSPEGESCSQFGEFGDHDDEFDDNRYSPTSKKKLTVDDDDDSVQSRDKHCCPDSLDESSERGSNSRSSSNSYAGLNTAASVTPFEPEACRPTSRMKYQTCEFCLGPQIRARMFRSDLWSWFLLGIFHCVIAVLLLQVLRNGGVQEYILKEYILEWIGVE